MSFPAVVAIASLIAACSGGSKTENAAKLFKDRHNRALGSHLPPGCLYGGRWFTDGVEVDTKETCLQCICHSGALTCRRKACAPLPDPPHRKCHVIYKKGSCCPELQCPDGVVRKHAVARSEDVFDDDFLPPTNVFPACVEGGTVYAAGSALRPTAACETCFCLHAERRCLRPKCLPPPKGCKPQPAPGACCPQRYYCQHSELPHKNNTHDCQVNGSWIPEGQRVQKSEEDSCSQCFCLRGAVHCHTVQCAPPLRGCTPLHIPGECCPRQYHCEHGKEHYVMAAYKTPNNALTEIKHEDRSFHDTKPTTTETTTNSILTKRSTPTTVVTNDQVSTTKVKRKTEDTPNVSSTTLSNITTTVPSDTITSTDQIQLESVTEKAIEQPEETVKVMVNGTINCTAEISSTKIPYNNTTFNESMFYDAQPRIPILNSEEFEAQTYSPNDIITDRNQGFDETDTFTINVTSSLVTNTSQIKPSVVSVSKPVPNNFVAPTNTSKKTKGDYDYDYTEPTLPPSLPNLKIIPFVAADAVVDDEAPKETLTYPMLEREDKFPVYYPTIDTKDTPFTNRREDTYPPKYPVFISDKETQYPSLTHDLNMPSNGFGSSSNDLEYTVPTALGDHMSKVVTAKTSKFETEEAPAVGLFSPPVETEGGFIPKDPEAIDNYFALYTTTQSAVSMPHLTTSMQLDVTKECTTSDGRRVREGSKASVWCSNCVCHSGELRCTPRDCSVPTGCRRLPITSEAKDLCCGDLVCGSVSEEYTISPIAITTGKQIENNTTVRTEDFSLTFNTDTLQENNTQNELITGHEIKPVEVNSIKNVDEVTTTTLVTETTPQQQNDTNSDEYEDEEDDTSFGSLLQLLLSGEVESTVKPKTTKSTTKIPLSTTLRPYRPTLPPFIPLPPRPFIPPNKASVNRIDHLVLGEAAPIQTTQRPEIKTNRPATSRAPAVTKKDEFSVQYTSVTHEGPRPPNLGLGAGILKISGCNIYGKMHGVGNFVPELSTNCQECWCADYGVQCKPKKC